MACIYHSLDCYTPMIVKSLNRPSGKNQVKQLFLWAFHKLTLLTQDSWTDFHEMAATQEAFATHKEGKEEGHTTEPGRSRGEGHCECDPCISSSCTKGHGHHSRRTAKPSVLNRSCVPICGSLISGRQCQDNSCRGRQPHLESKFTSASKVSQISWSPAIVKFNGFWM